MTRTATNFAPTFALAVATLALAAGCASHRELVIRSDPPGAQVRLDDQIVGWTPYTTSFEAYGTRRVTLYRKGFRSASQLVTLTPPWYGRFPFDIFSEVVIPVGWRDEESLDLVLEPESGQVTEPDLEAVLQRAESLRMATPEGPLKLPPRTKPSPDD